MASELLGKFEHIELWGDPEIVKLSGYLSGSKENCYLTVELKNHYFIDPIEFIVKRDTRADFNYNHITFSNYTEGVITKMVDGVERNTGVKSLNVSLDSNTRKIEVIVSPNDIIQYEEQEPEPEPEEPEPEEPEPEPEMSMMIQNYNVVNAYVDTSFINFSNGNIMVSSFSSDGGNKQERPIKDVLRVTANDGYKFDLDNLEDYYFDVQFQREDDYDLTLPFTRVSLSEFEPVTDISSYDWLLDSVDYPLYQSINPEGSMYYTFTVGDTEHLILLYGGLRERDLLFFTFIKWPYRYETFTMNGVGWTYNDTFSIDKYDVGTGQTIVASFLENLNFVAIPTTSVPIEDTSKYLFNTYYINNEDLSILKENSGLVDSVIINTYSYPLNFIDDDLVEVDFSVANITKNIPAKRFLKNNTSVEIFRFTIPDIPDVTEVRVRIPFNNDVVLNYEDVRGKTITGRFVYEVLTNSTTLFINDGISDIYKTIVGVSVVVPYKPTGAYDAGNEPSTRLSVDEPKLFIKGVGQTVQGNYIQGFIREVVKDMLNSERDKLNSLLKDGVFFND